MRRVPVPAVALLAAALASPAPAAADPLITSRFGHTEAQSIAITPHSAGSSHEERFDIAPGEGGFTFDESPAPAPASSANEEGTADATAGAVFHASASESASGALSFSASGTGHVTAAVTDTDPTTGSSHFAEGSALSTLQVSFDVRDHPAPYRISGSASGPAFAELRDAGDVVLVRIQPGRPASGVTGTLPPGSYTLEYELELEVEAQAPGSHSAGDDAQADVSLSVGAVDTDGDAIPDDAEQPGTELAAMGADPRHKDIFLELDYMPPHRFDDAAASQIVDAFADAPVPNPDGVTGIALHLDNGPSSVMNPKTGAVWGSRSRQNALVHQNVLGSMTAGGDYDWSAFDALKATSFEAARRAVFHYAISAHGHDGRISGLARGIPGSDLLVTLGAGCAARNGGVDCNLGPTAMAGTLMHELGHNLGLRHGGGDDEHYKPNYLSVMNYAFQLEGLKRTDGSAFLDYSRSTIPLDELAIDENQGLGITGGDPAALLTLVTCPNGTRSARRVAAGPFDADCDGTAAGVIGADVNGSGARTALAGFTDWPALVFDGGAIGSPGATLPATTPRAEVPLEELEAAAEALRAGVPGLTPPGGGPSPQPGTGTPPATQRRAGLTKLRIVRRKVTFRLSAAARVRFTIRRVGRRAPVRRFTRAGKAGTNRVRLPKLGRGRYVLVLRVVDGGATRKASFRVR